MRELKFRAWDGESGRFIDEGFSISMDGTCLYFEDCEEIFLSDYPEITIEQYTGLKDMNGKEIYEGDIIITSDDMLYVVVFNEGCFEAESIKCKDDALYIHRLSDFEVIGNIHENPELLTKGE